MLLPMACFVKSDGVDRSEGGRIVGIGHHTHHKTGIRSHGITVGGISIESEHHLTCASWFQRCQCSIVATTHGCIEYETVLA